MAEISDVHNQFDVALNTLNTSCTVAEEVQSRHEDFLGAADSTVGWIQGVPVAKGALEHTRGALDQVVSVHNVGQETEGKLTEAIQALGESLDSGLGALATEVDEKLGLGIILASNAARIVKLAGHSYNDLQADGQHAAQKAEDSEQAAGHVLAQLEAIGGSVPAVQEAINYTRRLKKHSEMYQQGVTGRVAEVLQETELARFAATEDRIMEAVLGLGAARGSIHKTQEKIAQACLLLEEGLAEARAFTGHLQSSIDSLSDGKQEMVAMTSDVKVAASILRDNQGVPDAMVEDAGAARTKVEQAKADI